MSRSDWARACVPPVFTTTRLHAAAVVAAALPGLCTAAHGQTREAAATLPDVTVRATAPGGAPQGSPSRLATGRSAELIDTPFSITGVPASQLREQAVTTLQDALRNVPGAQADSGFNGAHAQFFVLRGAIADNGTGASRVLRDGVRLSNYPYAPAFVERVDVLRGPGAALGVRSEPGGTVDLVTRQPRMEDASSVSAGVGSAQARELTVDLNRVLSVDNGVAARVIATRSSASQWRHVPDVLDGLKLGIAQAAGERYHLRAGIEVTDQRLRPDYGLPAIDARLPDVPRDRQLGEPFGDSTVRTRIADVHADIALTEGTRLAIDATRLDADSTSIRNLLVGSPLAGQPAGTFARSTSWEPGTTRRTDSLAASLTSNPRWGGVVHRLHGGVEFYRETLDQPSLSLPAALAASASPPINVFAPVYGRVGAPPAGSGVASLTTQALGAWAVSAQDQIDLGDWTAVAGLRLERQDFRYGAPGVLAVQESRWSPKAALLRRFGEADTVYASVGSGLAPNQVASSGNQSLPSRRSQQIEAGWKSAWNDGRLRSDVAVYRLAQTHLISSDLSTPNAFDFTLAGSARSQGVEASLGGEVARGLDVSLAYAFTDAKFRENAVYGGKAVPNVARHVLNAWAHYRWSEAWTTGAGVYLQGRRFADEANTTVLPGYGRLDLVQTWRRVLGGGRSVELQLALRNAADRRYWVSSHLHVNRWISPGEGRNAMVTLTFKK